MKESLWTAFEIFVNFFEAFVGMHFVCVFLGENIRKRSGFIKWIFLSFLFASATPNAPPYQHLKIPKSRTFSNAEFHFNTCFIGYKHDIDHS